MTPSLTPHSSVSFLSAVLAGSTSDVKGIQARVLPLSVTVLPITLTQQPFNPADAPRAYACSYIQRSATPNMPTIASRGRTDDEHYHKWVRDTFSVLTSNLERPQRWSSTTAQYDPGRACKTLSLARGALDMQEWDLAESAKHSLRADMLAMLAQASAESIGAPEGDSEPSRLTVADCLLLFTQPEQEQLSDVMDHYTDLLGSQARLGELVTDLKSVKARHPKPGRSMPFSPARAEYIRERNAVHNGQAIVAAERLAVTERLTEGMKQAKAVNPILLPWAIFLSRLDSVRPGIQGDNSYATRRSDLFLQAESVPVSKSLTRTQVPVTTRSATERWDGDTATLMGE